MWPAGVSTVLMLGQPANACVRGIQPDEKNIHTLVSFNIQPFASCLWIFRDKRMHFARCEPSSDFFAADARLTLSQHIQLVACYGCNDEIITDREPCFAPKVILGKYYRTKAHPKCELLSDDSGRWIPLPRWRVHRR
jgi:hypothetical protein